MVAATKAIPRICERCGAEFYRTISKKNNIESSWHFKNRKFCSHSCGNKTTPKVIEWITDLKLMPKDRPFKVKIFDKASMVAYDKNLRNFAYSTKFSTPGKFQILNTTYVSAWSELA